ncbi:hypothetical protein CBL_04464 [Carabus blaptoides fortunei]
MKCATIFLVALILTVYEVNGKALFGIDVGIPIPAPPHIPAIPQIPAIPGYGPSNTEKPDTNKSSETEDMEKSESLVLGYYPYYYGWPYYGYRYPYGIYG